MAERRSNGIRCSAASGVWYPVTHSGHRDWYTGTPFGAIEGAIKIKWVVFTPSPRLHVRLAIGHIRLSDRHSKLRGDPAMADQERQRLVTAIIIFFSYWHRPKRIAYPEMLHRTDAQRRRAWFGSYITTILQRDARDISCPVCEPRATACRFLILDG